MIIEILIALGYTTLSFVIVMLIYAAIGKLSKSKSQYKE
jgi:hypothetical protein